MSPHEEPHLIYSEDLWFEWFLDGILNADIDGKGGAPILHYLLDLNILVSEGNGLLKLSRVSKEQSSHEVKKRLLEALNSLSKSENGFALVYFLSIFSNKKLLKKLGLKYPKTPWGAPALGVKTRRNKSTNKNILQSRHRAKRK